MENNLRTLGPKEAKTVLSFREQGRSIVKAAGAFLPFLEASKQHERSSATFCARAG